MENTAKERERGNVLKDRPKCTDCGYIFQYEGEDHGTKTKPQCEDCEMTSFDEAFERGFM